MFGHQLAFFFDRMGHGDELHIEDGFKAVIQEHLSPGLYKHLTKEKQMQTTTQMNTSQE